MTVLRRLIEARVAATQQRTSALLRNDDGGEKLPPGIGQDELNLDIVRGSTGCSKVDPAPARLLVARAVAEFWAKSRRKPEEGLVQVSLACEAGRISALSVSGAFGFGGLVDSAYLVEGAAIHFFAPVRFLAVADLDGDARTDYIALREISVLQSPGHSWPQSQLEYYGSIRKKWVSVPSLRWAESEDTTYEDSDPYVFLSPTKTCLASLNTIRGAHPHGGALGGNVMSLRLEARHCWKEGLFRSTETFTNAFDVAFARLADQWHALYQLSEHSADTLPDWDSVARDLAQCARAADGDATCGALQADVVRRLVVAEAAPAEARAAVSLAAGRTNCTF